MVAPTPTVTAYWELTGATTAFVLDDPVRGVLDSATYVLGGDVATDISELVRSVTIRRGRQRAIEEITVGVANVVANNHQRQLDPEYSSGTYYGNIRPGKRFTVSATPDGGIPIPVFDGRVDDWDFLYPVDMDSIAQFDIVDGLAMLGAAEFDEWTTTAGQTPGVRLEAILDRPEVQFPASRNIDVGTSTLQADLVSWGSNVLNYCQLVAQADLGQLFAARDGVLTFFGRNRVVTGVGAPEFRDDGVGIVYQGVQLDYGTEQLFNRVSVDADGFTKQTVIDQDSIDLYGVRSLSIPRLPLDSEAQALDLANFLLSLYKLPVTRFESVTVTLHDKTAAEQATILAVDIGSVVRVVYTPNGVGDPIDKYCLVEGVSHTISPSFHEMTFSLSNLADGFSGQPFVLDDSEFGLLDGTGRLAF